MNTDDFYMDTDGLYTTLARPRTPKQVAWDARNHQRTVTRAADVLAYIRAYVAESVTGSAPWLRCISREMGISSSETARLLRELIASGELVGTTAEFQLREAAEAARRAVQTEAGK